MQIKSIVEGGNEAGIREAESERMNDLRELDMEPKR